jgi:hypothetical protein
MFVDSKQEEIRRIMKNVQRLSDKMWLKNHQEALNHYWMLDDAIETCDDEDIIAQMIEIESHLGAKNLNKFKENRDV